MIYYLCEFLIILILEENFENIHSPSNEHI